MTPRPVPISRAWTWFVQALNLGARNPRAVFGAALLLVGCVYLLLLLGGTLVNAVGGAGSGQPGTAMLGMLLVMALAGFMVLPVLIGGLMHVIREAEQSRPVRAADLFQPIRAGRGLHLAAFGALQVVLVSLAALITRKLLGDDYIAAYMEAFNAAMQQQTPPALPQPAHPLAVFLWQTSANYFTATVSLLGIALVSLSGLGFGQAVRSAISATLRNLLPNFLAAALFFVTLFVSMLIVSMLGTVLLAVLGKLFAPLAMIVGFVLVLAVASAMLVVVCGGAYLIWRDTFGDDESGAGEGMGSRLPAAEHQIEL